jgi:tetratricopeptide (TPR) repeat protein
MWENTNVPVKIEVPTDKKVTANIKQIMAGPTAGDYYNAAVYYRTAKKDLQQALEWMNKSIEMGNERFWVYRQKSLIQADMGDFKGAVATANKSLDMSKEAGNADYIKMNEESIKEWSKKIK